jgi:hypothetical protein
MPHTKVKQETNMVRDKYVSISFTAIFINCSMSPMPYQPLKVEKGGEEYRR